MKESENARHFIKWMSHSFLSKLTCYNRHTHVHYRSNYAKIDWTDFKSFG
jgi:hypothetical protein